MQIKICSLIINQLLIINQFTCFATLKVENLIGLKILLHSLKSQKQKFKIENRLNFTNRVENTHCRSKLVGSIFIFILNLYNIVQFVLYNI